MSAARTPFSDPNIDSVWFLNDYQPPHTWERVLPTGHVELVFSLTGGALRCRSSSDGSRNHFAHPILSGAQSGHFLAETASLRSSFGIRLKPGAVWRLFGIPAQEIGKSHIDLARFLGHDSRILHEKISNASRQDERLRLLHSALPRRSRRESHAAVTWAADQLTRYAGSLRVSTLVYETGLSVRRFNQLFFRETGLGAKTFARIQRFQSVIRKLPKACRFGWTALAQETGYADQAHLIREFREFSGLTPTAFLATGTAVFSSSN